MFFEHAHDLKSLKRGIGGLHRLEAERGFDQTLEFAVVGFDDVVEVFAHSVRDRIIILLSFRIDPRNGNAVGRVFVGRDGMWPRPVWRGADGFFEEARGGTDIANVGQVELESVAPVVHGAIEIFPLPFDLDVGFINPP